MVTGGADGVRRRILFVVLVDISASLTDYVPASCMVENRLLSEVVIERLNELIAELYRRYNGDQSSYREVAVVGYSGNGVKTIVGDGGRRAIPIAELGQISISGEWLEIRALTQLDRFGWYDELPCGDSMAEGCLDFKGCRAMLMGFLTAAKVVEEWQREQLFDERSRACVINLTGGIPEDCSAEVLDGAAQFVKSINRDNTLVMNVLMNERSDSRRDFSYPTDKEPARDRSLLVRLLASLSSVVDGRRAVGVNASVLEMLSRLDIDGEKFAAKSIRRRKRSKQN